MACSVCLETKALSKDKDKDSARHQLLENNNAFTNHLTPFAREDRAKAQDRIVAA